MNRLINPSDYYTVDPYGDYFTDAGFGKGAQVEFRAPGEYGPKGELYGYHIKQEAPDNDNIYDGDDRYVLAEPMSRICPMKHDFQPVGITSPIPNRWDYRSAMRQRDIDLEELNRDSVSFINLTKNWEDQTLRITAASRLDPYYYSGLPYVEREPQIHYEYYTTPIMDTNFYINFMMDYGRYTRELGATFPLNKDTLFDQASFIDEVDRFDSRFRVSYPVSFPNIASIRPWAGARFTNYSDPSDGSMIRALSDTT